MTRTDAATFEGVRSAVVKPLGHFAWLVDAGGVGSSLRMNFGAPTVTLQESPRAKRASLLGAPGRLVRAVRILGEHHLWLHQCDWQVRIGGKSVVDAKTATREALRDLATLLTGQRLVSFAIEPAGLTHLEFDLDTAIVTSPLEALDEQWFLYDERAGTVLTLRGDGCIATFPIDVRDPQEDWTQLTEELRAQSKRPL